MEKEEKEYFDQLYEKYCSDLKPERLYYDKFKDTVKKLDVDELYNDILKEDLLGYLIDKYNITEEDSMALFRRDELLRLCVLNQLL